MKHMTTPFSLAAVLLLIGAGCSTTTTTTVHKSDTSSDQLMTDDAQMEDNTNMIDATVDLNMHTTDTKVKGSYETYTPEKVALAKSDDDVVLFFYASWCPTCKALNDDLTDHTTELPDNLTILKVDYDTETALKKKYGVTYQHTLVHVDSKGNMISKWSGGNTLDSIVSKVK